MIFELKFECIGFEERLAFFIQQVLKNEKIDYVIFQKEGVFLWIECLNLPTEKLESITQTLSNLIPQSLFIGEINSQILENEALPKEQEKFLPKESYAYCPKCLQTQEGEECEICKKRILIPSTQDFLKILTLLQEGKSVKIVTESGEHSLSTQKSSRIYCLDLASVLEVCNLTPKELQALASYEKPIIKVGANQEFGLEVSDVFLSIAHDLELLGLFNFLKEKGIKFLFGQKHFDEEFVFAPCVGKPQEVLVLENDRLVVLKDSNPSLKLENIFREHQSLDKAFLSTILEENSLKEQNILNFYFSLNGGDKICLYNSQTQWFNGVMDFPLPKDLFELLDLIGQDGESGEKLIQNYKKAFPALCEKNISFENFPQGMFGIWEIARVILDLEENPLFLARKNLTQRGVAIEYSFQEDSLIAQKFNLVKCIRSGMSFKLAGVESGILALGYIESFSLFPSKLYLSIRKLVEIDGISLCGNFFSSKMLGDFFYKNNRQTPIYRNISFPLLYQ